MTGEGGSRGWRPPVPAHADRLRWPQDFGSRFIIFVDTEEEFDWSAPFSREARSVHAVAALPAMHQRFRDRGIAPCYLCDYPVVADEEAAAILRNLMADGQSAIGAQLHPWVNPPHLESPSALLSFAGNLPPALEAAKLDTLTAAITRATGTAPLAFRAGRYGLGPHTLGLLAARGYRLDTSMRAYHDYSAQGGPDYRAVPNDAFRVGPGGALIEMPLTTIYTGALRRSGSRWDAAARRWPRAAGALARARLLSRVPLTPEGVSIAEACAAVRIAVAEGPQVLSFSFHSPSLAPGNTPYVRDGSDLRRFHHWWDTMFDLLDRLGVRGTALHELLEAADRAV